MTFAALRPDAPARRPDAPAHQVNISEKSVLVRFRRVGSARRWRARCYSFSVREEE